MLVIASPHFLRIVLYRNELCARERTHNHRHPVSENGFWGGEIT